MGGELLGSFRVRSGQAARADDDGSAASALIRGYQLHSMSGTRMRVLAEWALNVLTPAEVTSPRVISAVSVPLDVKNPRS